ncbi:hypothetical protein SBRY_40696 [Actinacidiphila bryophytorum]|uniref:Uncharacterized protein n=1 Tax=Actinacidiphila bryophytorum TaxID=1436133 RepID=A0A9W4MC10_9ACTN|nr:hypothetical protein SBRY_40696 [Actinacidiphila bryophytorum]
MPRTGVLVIARAPVRSPGHESRNDTQAAPGPPGLAADRGGPRGGRRRRTGRLAGLTPGRRLRRRRTGRRTLRGEQRPGGHRNQPGAVRTDGRADRDRDDHPSRTDTAAQPPGGHPHHAPGGREGAVRRQVRARRPAQHRHRQPHLADRMGRGHRHRRLPPGPRTGPRRRHFARGRKLLGRPHMGPHRLHGRRLGPLPDRRLHHHVRRPRHPHHAGRIHLRRLRRHGLLRRQHGRRVQPADVREHLAHRHHRPAHPRRLLPRHLHPGGGLPHRHAGHRRRPRHRLQAALRGLRRRHVLLPRRLGGTRALRPGQVAGRLHAGVQEGRTVRVLLRLRRRGDHGLQGRLLLPGDLRDELRPARDTP